MGFTHIKLTLRLITLCVNTSYVEDISHFMVDFIIVLEFLLMLYNFVQIYFGINHSSCEIEANSFVNVFIYGQIKNHAIFNCDLFLNHKNTFCLEFFLSIYYLEQIHLRFSLTEDNRLHPPTGFF